MAQWLRMLNSTKRGLDAARTGGIPSWCTANEVPAPLLGDWCDENPSLWLLVPGTENDLLAAIVGKRKEARDIEYVVFDDSLIKSASLNLKKTRGTCGVESFDKKCHRVIEQLSSGGLGRLLRLIVDQKDKAKVESVSIKAWRKKKAEEIEQRVTSPLAAFTEPDEPPTSTAMGIQEKQGGRNLGESTTTARKILPRRTNGDSEVSGTTREDG